MYTSNDGKKWDQQMSSLGGVSFAGNGKDDNKIVACPFDDDVVVGRCVIRGFWVDPFFQNKNKASFEWPAR